MTNLIFIGILLSSSIVCAGTTAPFPLFLRSGFSSVIEFNEAPTQVVLGDSQSFQVEKLNRSLAIKCINPNTSSNLFVYFNGKEPYVFLLTASDEAEPTYYRKFDFPEKTPPLEKPKRAALKRSFLVKSAVFSSKKDSLIVNVQINADSSEKISPLWNKARLHTGKNKIKPSVLWSEREVVQKDSSVKAKFTFLKPDVPRHLKGVVLTIPIKEQGTPVEIKLSGRLK